MAKPCAGSVAWARLAIADALKESPERIVRWWDASLKDEHRSVARTLGKTTKHQLVNILVDVLRALNIDFERYDDHDA